LAEFSETIRTVVFMEYFIVAVTQVVV